MNNMKKALALVMSLALAASTFVVGAAYDDVPENHDNRIAINLLGDLGVMVGDAGTNDFRPEGTLKRSEAAAIVYRLRTGKTNADSYVGTTGFSDVSDSHWASGYINYCVNQGIIAGYPDGTFKPDQDVTYAEYIKMVVCALNLQKVTTTTYIDMNTGVLVSEDKITTEYPTGYIALASDQQINEGIDYLNPNDKITRAEVAQGAYNAIFESYYKLDPKDADYVKDGTTYQHLAEQVFKLNKTTGIVTAFEDYTAEKTGDAQESNTFLVKYENDNGKEATKSFEYADFNSALLGQEVYVWEKDRNISSATDKAVVAVVATEDNMVTTINTNDLKKDNSDWYYTDANGKKQTIKNNTDLNNTGIILNGQVYNIADLGVAGVTNVSQFLAAVAETRLPMDLTFIDNDNSPKSPSYISIKVYGETEVTSVTNDKLYIKNIQDTYNYNSIATDKTGIDVYEALFNALAPEKIYDTATGSIDLLNDDDTVNNKVTYYEGIAKEDKVMVYADVNGVIDIRKIEEVSGTVTAMSGAKFRLDDKEVYVVAGDDMKSLMTSNTNSDATAYIDPFTGYVINVDEGVGNVEDYYYVHMVQKEYATSNDYQLTAYDYEGNKVKLTFKDAATQKTVLKKLGITDPDSDFVNKDNFLVIDRIGVLDVNSKGQITGWKANNVGTDKKDVTYDKDAEYNSKTGYVTIDGARVEVKPSSVVFGVTFDGSTEKIDEVKTYVGSFPKLSEENARTDYMLKDGDDDLKAAVVRAKTKGGNTEFTNVTGYVLGASFEYTDKENKKGKAIYTIATKGEIKQYETEVTDDTDLRDTYGELKGMMIKFDLTTDGKILYSDSSDIEVVGVVNGKLDTFEKMVAAGTMTDFDAIHPGMSKMDEDQIYFGIVVESKDGKYIQLVDNTKNANGKYDSIIIDYADSVKAYRIDDQKWDKATVGTTGNITDSNANYTTYAAVRIVDGDDVNKAAVTEIYTKTVESKVFANLGGNFEVVSGEKTGDVETETDVTLKYMSNEMKKVAQETGIKAGADYQAGTKLYDFSGITPSINGSDYTLSVVSDTVPEGSVVVDSNNKLNLKSEKSTGIAEGKYSVTVKLTAKDGKNTEMTLDVVVGQSDADADKAAVAAALATVTDKTLTAAEYNALGSNAAIFTASGEITNYAVTGDDFVKQDSNNVAKNGSHAAPTAAEGDKTYTVKVTATKNAATDSKEITLTIKATTAQEELEADMATKLAAIDFGTSNKITAVGKATVTGIGSYEVASLQIMNNVDFAYVDGTDLYVTSNNPGGTVAVKVTIKDPATGTVSDATTVMVTVANS